MHDFKQYQINERLDRNSMLANTFKAMLQDYGKLSKQQIEKIIAKILINDVPYYKAPKSHYKDYNPPKTVGFEIDIEKMFNHALATVNQSFSK